MASGLTIANSTTYYAYVSELGTLFLDTERPYDRAELQGKYHPYHLWRSLGVVTTDGSAHLTQQFPKLTASAVGLRGLAMTATSGTVTQTDSAGGAVASLVGTAKDLGLKAYLTTSGNPVRVSLMPVLGAAACYVEALMTASAGGIQGYLVIEVFVLCDGVAVSSSQMAGQNSTSSVAGTQRVAGAPASFMVVHTPAAGKHVYTWSMQASWFAQNGASTQTLTLSSQAHEVLGMAVEESY